MQDSALVLEHARLQKSLVHSYWVVAGAMKC